MVLRVVRVGWFGGWGLIRLAAPSGASDPAPAAVCLNEVLYDPAGPDAGAEFVELYNTSAQPISLAGWRLEAGNGASPGDWRVQWQGEAGHVVRPGAFFLVAGESVAGPADARAALSLQNGPDAVRLVAPQGVVDRLGWGAHVHAEFAEGQPAPDAASGWSLARVPDGRDTDANAADFVARPWPSPGRPNAAAGRIELTDLRCDPPVLDHDTAALIEATVTNLGLEPVALDGLAWRLEVGSLTVAETAPPLGRLAPSAAAVCRWTLAPPGADAPPGVVRTSASAVGPEGETGPLEAQVRVGRGAVVVAEIQYDPVPGEGEWVELCNLGDVPIDLGGWGLRDASGHATVIAAGERIEAHGCVLLAEDRQGLCGRWPDVSAGTVLARAGAWPGLNNSLDRAWGYADEVLLLDADGAPVDYVRYAPGGLDGGGITLERWIEVERLIEPRLLIACAASGGATPGAVGGPPGGARGAWLTPDPSPYAPDAQGAPRLCSVRVPAPAGGSGRLSAAVYSLAGDRVATLCAAAQVHGPSVLLWDGRDGAGRERDTGLYLVRIELASPVGAGGQRIVRPLVLVRG